MSIYNTCYDLVAQYVYGGVDVGTYQELCCIAVATIACLFMFSLPFVVVWFIIRAVTRF